MSGIFTQAGIKSIERLLVVGTIAAVMAIGQERAEPRVYSVFISGDPIVEATVTAVKPSAQGPESGTLSINISSVLRGEFKQRQLEIPYNTHINPKYPPFVWQRVPPVAGHHVILFLHGDGGQTFADEVLDLDAGERKYMPKLESLLKLEKEGAAGDVKPLIDLLGSSDQDIRSLAAGMLLAKRCLGAAPCRAETLARLESVARDTKRPGVERVWAASQIAHNVYTGIPATAATDQAAANALAGLLGDPDTAVRDEAIQDLHGLVFGGGTAKPRIEIAAGEKARVMAQLQRDAQAGLPFSSQAKELSDLITKQ